MPPSCDDDILEMRRRRRLSARCAAFRPYVEIINTLPTTGVCVFMRMPNTIRHDFSKLAVGGKVESWSLIAKWYCAQIFAKTLRASSSPARQPRAANVTRKVRLLWSHLRYVRVRVHARRIWSSLHISCEQMVYVSAQLLAPRNGSPTTTD